MAFDARAVANYFLDRAFDEGAELDHMSVQNLTFLAQGWHLAALGRPLFANLIEAWPNGPMIPDVYAEFKHVGRDPIEDRAFTFEPTLNAQRVYDIGDSDLTLDQVAESRNVLDRVWGEYGESSGAQLVALTTRVGSPWHRIAGGRKREEFRHLVIPHDLIRQYYVGVTERAAQHA